MAETKIRLTLWIDKKANKVLFAEAGKDFVDFLFSLLSLTVGTTIWILNTANMVGSIGNLYYSLETFCESHLQSSQHKNLLLKSNRQDIVTGFPFLLSDTGQDRAKGKFYRCFDNHPYVTDNIEAICPSCKFSMCHEVPFVKAESDNTTAGSTSEGGTVKGLATHTVMDDLPVMPMSTISGMVTHLKKFDVTDLSVIEERVVDFGFKERLQMLKACLESKTVLTDVYILKKELKVKEEKD